MTQLESSASSIFWLDRNTIDKVITSILEDPVHGKDVRNKRIREIKNEAWDLFLRVLADGSIVVTAVIVRRYVFTQSSCLLVDLLGSDKFRILIVARPLSSNTSHYSSLNHRYFLPHRHSCISFPIRILTY